MATAAVTPTVDSGSKTNSNSLSKRLASRGFRTTQDFANIMGALFCDVIIGAISPDVCSAASHAGGKLLQVVALQCKYGSRGPNGMKTLVLADLSESETAARITTRKAPSSEAKTRTRSRAA
jgi:hypothetical protein